MFDYYKVKKGDTLDTICNTLKIDKKKVMELNDIKQDDESLRVDSLKVPFTSNVNYFDTYTIEKGDSLYAIARKYNINPELLASMNGLNMEDYIYPGQELLIPKSGFSYYITKDGDTINLVSGMFKITKEEVLEDNPVIYLKEGQILVHKK